MRQGGGGGDGDGGSVVVDGGDGGVVRGRQKMKIKVSLCVVLLLGCHQFPLANPLAAGLTTSLEHHASPANTTNTTTD